MTRGEELNKRIGPRECTSDEEKVLIINDFLVYFADKYSSDRTLRRRFAKTMESLDDIMVKEGYWERSHYPKD